MGAGVLSMLDEHGPGLARRYGAPLVVTGVAELGGAAVALDGLELGELRRALAAGRALGELPNVGRPAMTPLEMLAESHPDILLEATPVNLRDGQPGLGTALAALCAGVHVVLANKAPLALSYDRLAALSDLADGWGGAATTLRGGQARPRLRFSATVAGALPVINIGWRDLAGCLITRVEAVFNGTSHSILRAMETGQTFAEALADAQRRGIAETDPAVDIDGHDAACKLVITANAVLGQPSTIADVSITGIRDVSVEDVRAASQRGECLVPMCLAELQGHNYRLSVGPASLPKDHPLARITPDEMSVVFYSDRVARLSASSLEPGPEPASASMIRDVLDIIRTQTWASGTN